MKSDEELVLALKRADGGRAAAVVQLALLARLKELREQGPCGLWKQIDALAARVAQLERDIGEMRNGA